MPLSSKTTLSTAKASGYVAQLGKHFGHKIEVEQTSDGTVFHFSAGTARAQAQGDLLHLSAQADTAENLHKVETILGSHLERFAFREDLRVAWPENPSVK
jgi:hypothetical protein